MKIVISMFIEKNKATTPLLSDNPPTPRLSIVHDESNQAFESTKVVAVSLRSQTTFAGLSGLLKRLL